MSQNQARSKGGSRSPTLNLVSVKQALLVAQHLSFRRAADALGVRQSAVSRRVRELEDELGVSLFERHHTGVRVTNAGSRFFQEVQEPLLQLDHAFESATAAGSGAIGRLSIGVLSSIATGYLRELIQLYRARHPDIALHILEDAPAESVSAVVKRKLDVAFIMGSSQAEGCDTMPLWKERIFVVLPQEHALCEKKEIAWSDLRNERLIVRHSDRDPALCERLMKRLAAGKQSAAPEKLRIGRDNLMNLVAMGLGVGFTSAATIATPFPKVVFRPIAGDDELLQFNAAWLPHNDNPALRRFLSLARSMAKEKQWRSGSTPVRTPPEPPVTGAISLYVASLGALARRLGLST